MTDAVPRPASFLPIRFLGWFACGTLWALALAWASVGLQSGGFAPVGLLSLLIGILLGGGLAAFARWIEFGHRRAALLGTLGLALLTVGGEHGFSYRRHLQGMERAVQANPKLALARAANEEFRPPTVAEYLRASAERGRLWIWGLDAVLIALAAVVVTGRATALPYCSACHSWYRVTRRGKLDNVGRLAEACRLDLPRDAGPGQFRVLACQSGCGPAQLTVSWTRSDGAQSTATGWLPPEQTDVSY